MKCVGVGRLVAWLSRDNRGEGGVSGMLNDDDDRLVVTGEGVDRRSVVDRVMESLS